jgi:chromosome segregation ATPase
MRKGQAVELRKDRGTDTVRDNKLDPGVAFAAVHSKDVATHKSDEERMSLFWRVFGGTILSIVALVAITIYNTQNNAIAELRSEISRINEARGELIKKDEFNSRISTNYERVQQLQTQNNGLNATITSLQTALGEMKDRLTAVKADADAARKEALAADAAAKKELTLVLDAMKKELVGLEAIKERLTMAFAEVKDHRDDIARLKQETDRNNAADAERKKSRDEQYAKVLDAVKDLDKAVRTVAEKVARLEGATKPVTPMPKSGEDD